MSEIGQVTTAEQLLHASDLGRCELLRGELVMMSPSGFEHGRLVTSVATPLDVVISGKGFGVVLGGETGFRIARDPDTVRAPDVAFVRAERVSSPPCRGFFPGAPDLAVDILSPDDRASEVLAKVQDWLEAGCQRVWVVDPRTRSITVYRSPGEIVLLRENSVLTDDELLPGFSLNVADVFR
ncbi:MAG: Uma2 family endonuclease [Planctomycetes bacterium]|nr:Uma2 family endonuclease [Planctomycetota bacterium]